jgi:MraZ protein
MSENIQNDLVQESAVPADFMGTNATNLDAKNRFTVPSRWREALGNEKTLYLMPGIGEGEQCLWVYPKAVFAPKLAKLRAASMADKGARAVARLFAGGSVDCEWDSQGRIRLTDHLLEHANLKKDIQIVGAFSRFEIWEPELYKQFQDQNMPLVESSMGDYL